MKFNFKIQSYQTDAVNSIVSVFAGQPKYDDSSENTLYARDIGKKNKNASKKEITELQLHFKEMGMEIDQYDAEEQINSAGYRNADIVLSDDLLLDNIKTVQAQQNIHQSSILSKDLGRCSLDVEMETGTGKTYVYIKTMFELNKQYGWNKFIIVVPSIAIREGVKKSMEMTVEHFMEYYGKKARFFVYNSSDLNALDKYSSDAGINVMIINTQAFASSLKEGAKNKESRIIYSVRDDFGSRRPIDVIKVNRPIVILDEPQKMGGAATQKGIKNFNPLFTINYSATHKNHHNEVYVLDALDAYNKKLVKKIHVKGFEIHNLRGTDRYIFFEKIIISSNKPPMAKLEIEVRQASGVVRRSKVLGEGDNLFLESNGLQQYKDGYVINHIDPFNSIIEFINGEALSVGTVVGDVSEKDMRRIQIRETIQSHFDKEESLFRQGIKTLSLFFIDEVSKYRIYDEFGDEQLGEYGKIFEEEYKNILSEKLSLFAANGEDAMTDEYQKYLRRFDAHQVHKGYFSIDKKGHSINSELKKGSDISDDISAYDLILKNKERLLSFEEPTRFIFSHSALREGWDNPNVFQICTLKHSDSATAKRQEVGRGLRLAVNKSGIRMDAETIGEDLVHEINKLTVIASESYSSFVSDLQKETKEVLYDRPTKATTEYFKGKILTYDGQTITIDDQQAASIIAYLSDNDYIDSKGNITVEYHKAVANGTLEPLPKKLRIMEESIHKLIQSIFDEHALDGMIENGHETTIQDNCLNDNFKKKEFQELWRRINHKYAYTVDFDSEELIRKSVEEINSNLHVAQVRYSITTGQQEEHLSQSQVASGTAFSSISSRTQNLRNAHACTTSYDLIGDIAKGAVITRKTASRILSMLDNDKKYMFAINPEEFIIKVINMIKAQKATMIVEHITYNQIEGKYDSSIFTSERRNVGFDKAIRTKRHITDYVFTDGTAEDSIEKKFCQSLEKAEEVEVYAKLPKGFHIPTPVGNYSPDWAIAFKKGTVKHIFFIAETKGTMESLQFRKIEEAKIKCATKLFNEISTEGVCYHEVSSYKELLDVMETIK